MVASLYSIWVNKKNPKIKITVLGFTKTLPDTGNQIIVGNESKGVLSISPEYLLDKFQKYD